MPLISKAFGDIITFTRASTGSFFNSAGVLTSAAINAPRLDYNPSTLAAQGLLIEEQRTNSIRNNTMQGAVAGTPGTLPTNWSTSAGGSGITRTLVGTGTENGITYVDFQFSGTGSGTAFQVINTETTTGVAAATGQTWSGSFYLKLVAGSTTGTSITMQLLELASGSGVVQNLSAALSPTTQNLATQRNTYSPTLSGGGTVTNLQQGLRLLFTNGVAVDITLRIGLPQLEQGAFATSVIPTTTAAVTRSADVASVNTLSPWYNASAGTMYAEIGSAPVNTVVQFAYELNDNLGSGLGRIFTRRTSAGQVGTATISGGVTQADVGSGVSIAGSAIYKVASAFAANDFAAALNGAAPSTSASGAVPNTIARLFLGQNYGGTQLVNGYLRRITYYPRRLSNAELVTLTT